ncbi:MAG: nucleoside deaminase [Clostridia bacterium]|nr:nucleoside deaminase [Clostridia bacterium]
MKQALLEAERALALGEVPVGAILVSGDDILARAYNLRETIKDPTAHAEILALKRAAMILGRWRLSDTTMYVTLEPCPMCAGALVQARVPVLVFGAMDPKAGAAGSVLNLVQSPALNHRMEVIGGICEEECQGLMDQFFAHLRDRGLRSEPSRSVKNV